MIVTAGAFAVPTAAAETLVTHVQFASSQFNQCAGGELIEILGKAVIVGRSSEEHLGLEFHFAGVRALAPSTGAEYVALTRSGFASYFKSDGTPSVFTSVQHIRFVRLGEDKSFPLGDDFDLRILVHTTVNPDGTTTSDVEVMELNCV